MTRKSKLLFSYGAIAAFGAALYSLIEYKGLHFLCVFNSLTGLRCPACGNTRAFISAMHGDFTAMFRHNIMFLPELSVLIFLCVFLPYTYIYGKKIPKCIYIFLVLAAVSFCLWGIVRNLFNI